MAISSSSSDHLPGGHQAGAWGGMLVSLHISMGTSTIASGYSACAHDLTIGIELKLGLIKHGKYR